MIQRLGFLAALMLVVLAVRDGLAQVVQLPTFRSFSVGTSVLVPDRGSAYLGGVNRAASGHVRHGVPLVSKTPGEGRLGGANASGSAVSAAGVSVTATIIDHREWDAAVLAEAQALRAARGEETTRREGANAVPPLRAPSVPIASVAELERQNAQKDQQREAEAVALVNKAWRAEADGKPSVARIYYQMAARRAEGGLREQIQRRLHELTAAELRLARSRP